MDIADGDFGMLEFIWRSCKVVFALSPLIGMVALFVMAYDDPAAEKKKRDADFDFALAGNEE
ncbi:unnamed protein product [Amoebophrya sp. A120]|nr:unnamed protein product [Amoebophrya sp. A120]|eukprot:GSA120T00023480001.1